MTTAAVTPVTPVVSQKVNGEKLTEVKVSVIEGKETALIAHNATLKYFNLAFSLQDAYENESAYTKDSMVEAGRNFLRAECARAISKWDNIVTKATKLQRYASMGRPEIEKSLQDNPKVRDYFKNAQRAAALKAQL